MRVIVSNLLPTRGFTAVNFFGVVFVRRERMRWFSSRTMNHEYIHLEQMKELLYVPFYLIYLAEWAWKLMVFRSCRKAYMNISFEREARAHQNDLDYLKTRKRYEQWKSK